MDEMSISINNNKSIVFYDYYLKITKYKQINNY